MPWVTRKVDYAVDCAGYRIAVRNGRVWLHPGSHADGDLSVQQALALAAALEVAARQARRTGRRPR